MVVRSKPGVLSTLTKVDTSLSLPSNTWTASVNGVPRFQILMIRV